MGGDDSVEPDDSTGDDDEGADQGDVDWGLGDDTEADGDDTEDADDDAWDPKRSKALITKLRGEVKASQKAAKAAAADAQTAATKAAADAQAAQARKLAIALGVIEDNDGDTSQKDADALLTDIQKQLADQASANNQLRQEIALRDAAAQHGADIGELLDRKSFLDSLSGLDPNAQGYSTRVAKAVADAIAKNPRLKRATSKAEPEKPAAPGVSGGEHKASTGSGPVTEAQLARMSPDEISKAYADGRLKHLL
jgi:hypothetical protein